MKEDFRNNTLRAFLPTDVSMAVGPGTICSIRVYRETDMPSVFEKESRYKKCKGKDCPFLLLCSF